MANIIFPSYFILLPFHMHLFPFNLSHICTKRALAPFIMGLVLFILNPNIGKAQKEIDISVNDTLMLGICAGDSGYFKFVEGLVKTRWPFPELTYDRETGKNFYNWFFNGDIDTRAIPCINEGLKFRVAAVQTLKDQKGNDKMVLFGSLENDTIILWIDLNEAWLSREILIMR